MVWVLNSHSHVMYILSTLLAEYSEVKGMQDYCLYETFDYQGLAINALHLKTLQALMKKNYLIRQ